MFSLQSYWVWPCRNSETAMWKWISGALLLQKITLLPIGYQLSGPHCQTVDKLGVLGFCFCSLSFSSFPFISSKLFLTLLPVVTVIKGTPWSFCPLVAPRSSFFYVWLPVLFVLCMHTRMQVHTFNVIHIPTNGFSWFQWSTGGCNALKNVAMRQQRHRSRTLNGF